MLFPLLVRILLLNISAPLTTALLRPAPDTHRYCQLGSSYHHSLHFLSSYSPPFWSLEFLYPLAYLHVPRLSPPVFYRHGKIIQVFDYVPFISQFKALLISSTRLASRRLLPQLLRQSLSFKKGSSFSKYIPMVKHCQSFSYLLIFLKAPFFFCLVFISYSIRKY